MADFCKLLMGSFPPSPQGKAKTCGKRMTNKNSEELYCVTSFGLKTEVDEIQRDKNYAEHKLVG